MTGANERSEPDFAAFIGIDWADQRHAWELQTTTEGTMKRGDLDHTPEAVDDWATELGRRFGGRPIAIALEQSRGALLFMLTKYAHFCLLNARVSHQFGSPAWTHFELLSGKASICVSALRSGLPFWGGK